MIKQLFSSLVILFTFNTVTAQTPCPDFEWAMNVDTLVDAIASDGIGNSYVTGTFYGTVTFGNTTLTSSGDERDIYIAKLDTLGNYVWAKKVGIEALSNGHNYGNSGGITVDSVGNVYVTGTFRGRATFGSTVLTSPLLQAPIFIAKLNASGNFVWARKIQGQNTQNGSDMYARGISVDASGHIYVTGGSTNRLVFGTIQGPTVGVFVTKLDDMGNFLWVKGSEYDQPYSSRGLDIAVDTLGNNYITGSFQGTLVLGNITLISNGENDIFIAKLDTNGNFIWAKQAGGASNYADLGNGIIIDAAGNSYITGSFNDTAVFGNTTLTTENSDIFVAKLDVSGNFIWAKQFGVTGSGAGNDIVVDAWGNTYITGTYQGSVTLGNTTLTAWDIQSDVFITKLDASGNNFLWAAQGSSEPGASGWGAGIAMDSSGNNYVAGVLGGDAVFGDYILNYGGFITKLNACSELGFNALDSSNISIYPNPSKVSFTVSGTPIGATLFITDIAGKVVYNKQTFSEQIVIETTPFTNGVYFVNIEHNGNRIVEKLIIKK